MQSSKRDSNAINKFNPLKDNMLQILDETGSVNTHLEPRLSEKDLKKMYKDMATAAWLI